MRPRILHGPRFAGEAAGPATRQAPPQVTLFVARRASPRPADALTRPRARPGGAACLPAKRPQNTRKRVPEWSDFGRILVGSKWSRPVHAAHGNAARSKNSSGSPFSAANAVAGMPYRLREGLRGTVAHCPTPPAHLCSFDRARTCDRDGCGRRKRFRFRTATARGGPEQRCLANRRGRLVSWLDVVASEDHRRDALATGALIAGSRSADSRRREREADEAIDDVLALLRERLQ